MAIPPSDSRVIVRSSHVSDPALTPFLAKTFDPAAYLNAVLPPLHLSATAVASRPIDSVPLVDLSSQTQSLLSQLNAQATRLSNVLTQLTEEILRSGTRLSYEVDVLKGEVSTLSELLNEKLQDDVEIFVPDGLDTSTANATTSATEEDVPPSEATSADPSYLTNLRTLSHVRTQLDTVISLFGSALSFTLPPSLLQPQSTSSFISVSAPAPPTNGQSAEDVATLERKGQEYVSELKRGLAELVEKGTDPQKGAEEARARVRQLRDLCGVWKGTAEEKARLRFVESIATFVEDKIAEAAGMGSPEARGGAVPRGVGSPSRRGRAGTQTRKEAEKGSGFLENLQRLRG